MPTTTTHAIKYPAGTVAPNVPLDMQTLAESADAAITKAAPPAKQANCTLTGANTTYSTNTTRVTREGIFVHLSGRINRTAQNGIVTIPVGYRPERDIFVPVHLNGNPVVLMQITATGVVSTPFSTASGDMMIDTVFTTALTAPQPA